MNIPPLGISNILPRRKEALGGIWYLALCSTPAGTFRSSVTWILWLPVNAWTLISNLLEIKFFCTFRIVVDITQLGKLCLIVCLGRRCCNVSNCPPKLIDFNALASILGRFLCSHQQQCFKRNSRLWRRGRGMDKAYPDQYPHWELRIKEYVLPFQLFNAAMELNQHCL